MDRGQARSLSAPGGEAESVALSNISSGPHMGEVGMGDLRIYWEFASGAVGVGAVIVWVWILDGWRGIESRNGSDQI